MNLVQQTLQIWSMNLQIEEAKWSSSTWKI